MKKVNSIVAILISVSMIFTQSLPVVLSDAAPVAQPSNNQVPVISATTVSQQQQAPAPVVAPQSLEGGIPLSASTVVTNSEQQLISEIPAGVNLVKDKLYQGNWWAGSTSRLTFDDKGHAVISFLASSSAGSAGSLVSPPVSLANVSKFVLQIKGDKPANFNLVLSDGASGYYVLQPIIITGKGWQIVEVNIPQGLKDREITSFSLSGASTNPAVELKISDAVFVGAKAPISNEVVKALFNFYGGQLPKGDYVRGVEKSTDSAGNVSWNVMVKIKSGYLLNGLFVQNQLITVKRSNDQFYVAEIREQTATNRVLQEKFYDTTGAILQQNSYEYYPGNATLKALVVVHFKNGIRAKVVHREFDAKGVLTRLLVRTYYPNGNDVETITESSYVKGVQSERIHREFSKNGTLLQKTLFTYFSDGKTVKVREAYNYSEKKRYVTKYDLKGKIISQQVLPI